ncbi:HD domain-containing phosphohydrolase [Desulfospira joergensenii]|uniref:HD domain-containing phosphohydrolase n=1 Tax=Desulfospira joergensenii TaxID=53329 RepID=UPI0003B755DC|nr:HD domain-containing phosphohydrolase [Desulfospira joergensenii]
MQYLSAVLPLFSSLLFLCLGITIYFLSRGTLRKVFLRFCIITFHWQFSWFILFLLHSNEYSGLICRIGYTGIIFLPVSIYESVVHYLRLPKHHIRWVYGLCLGFLASLWTTDYFIKGAYLQSFGYYPEAGPLHPAYMAMVFILMIRLFSLLYGVFKKETDTIKKNQLKYFFIASIVFCFASIDYILNYPALAKELGFQIYPIGVFFISFSVLVFILSHFLMLNSTLEKRVAMKTAQLEESVIALEEAARSKKDFIANVTHELRTPLTVIRGWTDYILDGESGQIPDHLLTIINKVGLQTLNLTEKINELLKVSKFDAGMRKLVLTNEDLNAVISQIVNSFKGLTDQRGIDLNFFGTPDLELVFIDREKLKDILNNLIRNAYKFTENGEIKVVLSREQDRIRIKVKDTGIGMSREVLGKIFQRFQQGDGSRTRKYEGTGLGLAIVKDSVELMHGEISVKSQVGQGTLFSILLPMDLEKTEPDAVIERRIKERRKKRKSYGTDDRRNIDRRLTDLAKIDHEDITRILKSERTSDPKTTVKRIRPENSKGDIVIAEDNKSIQEFLSAALKEYTLHIASNGRAAWQAINEHMPGLVISDIMMPIMDGYTLLEKIRTAPNTETLPVIIITSLTDQEDRIKSLQYGADDYLTKPFHHLELQARVKNVLSVHRLEREKTKSEQLEVFLMVLASVIESKDKYTGGHVERVAGYARDLARKTGLNETLVNEIYMGTIVHDVGKIGIKDEVLNKPGRLTDQEFEHIKEHPAIGKNLLSKLEIAPVAVNIAYSHQEKWDGTGYPQGLSGMEIPIEARIATIADVWDAITSDRPYRVAMPLEKAISIMHEERGKSFDPDLFDLFMDDNEKLYLKYIDREKKVLAF